MTSPIESILTFRAADYGCVPDSGHDATQAANRMVRDAANAEGRPVRIVFEPGRYDFWPDRALQRYCSISNNTNGMKSIVFPLFGLENIEIDGGGADFIFHGIVNPFIVEDCEGIALRNFSIDWDRPFYTQALILDGNEEYIDLRIGDEFPHEIISDRLYVSGEGWRSNILKSSIEFDPRVRGPAYMARDYYEQSNNVRAEALADGGVRLYGGYDGHKVHKAAGKRPSHGTPRPGNYLVFKNEYAREAPAVVVKGGGGLTLENIDLFHACGMGVVAEKSRDLVIREVRVRVREGSGRMVSVNADALHFVACKGFILVEDCLSEDQFDDFLNIHGNYGFVTGREDPDVLEIGLTHHEQLGFDLCGPGDTMEFHHRRSLRVLGEAVVMEVEVINERYRRVRFDRPIAEELGETPCVAENTTWTADLTVRNCRARNNRGRGILVKSRGKTRITGNTLSVGGTAVLMEGKTSGFCESGPVRDVVIEDNDFIDCKRGPWGRAVVDIRPMIEEIDPAAPYYHRNVIIRNNRFATFDPGRIAAYCVEGLEITGNRFERTGTFPPKEESMPYLIGLWCAGNVRIADNTCDAATAATPWLADAHSRAHLRMEDNELGGMETVERRLCAIGLIDESFAEGARSL